MDLFEKITTLAIKQLPKEFRDKLENVEVLVLDFPDADIIENMNLESKWDLLGLYMGVPITQRSVFASPVLPERIFLFKRPIQSVAGSPEEMADVIRDVLIHEIGHHFGFDEDDLERLERQ